MKLSRYLNQIFATSSSRRSKKRAGDRRRVLTVEMLEDRVVPANQTWTVESLADNGDPGTLRYILDKQATAGDLVVFGSSLYSAATGTDPSVIMLEKVPGDLTPGPLVVPSGVQLIGPTDDTSKGYEQPLIAIDGSNLDEETGQGAYQMNIIDITGSNTVAWPNGLPAGGDGYSTQDKEPLTPGGANGCSVVANLKFTNAQSNEAAVQMDRNDAAFLDDCTVGGSDGTNGKGPGTNADVGIIDGGVNPTNGSVYTGTDAYVCDSWVTASGSESGTAGTGQGGINVQSGNLNAIFSTISGNEASQTNFGGGVTNEGGGFWAVDSTIEGNYSKYGGGGILTIGGTLHLLSATIYDNQTPAKGGGIMLQGTMVAGGTITTDPPDPSALLITNTIIAGNQATAGSPSYDDIFNNGATIPSQFYRFNLIGTDGPTGDLSGLGWVADGKGDIVGKNSNIISPDLSPLLPNGGPTMTDAELWNANEKSPAIDAGDDLNADAPENYYDIDDMWLEGVTDAPVPIGTDQRGEPRPYPGTVQDIGAYEYQGTSPTVVTLSPGNGNASAESLPNAAVGSNYNESLTASESLTPPDNNGTFTYTLATGSGPLPSGVSIESNGTLTGTPASGSNGTYTFTVQASDDAGNTGDQMYQIVVTTANGLAISPTTLPVATLNQAYSETLTASGGSGSGYSFTESGTLPTGITFNNGVFSGTPTTSAGSPYSITVTVKDSDGNTATQSYTLTVNSPLSLSPAQGSLPPVVVDSPYSETFTGSGGAGGPYTYSESGTLPTGLTFANGQITGTDTTATDEGKSFPISVTVTDVGNNTVTNTYTISVEGPITISPATLPVGTVNDSYNQTVAFSATGGAGSPYTFAIADPQDLPPGLSMVGDVLQGDPTESGTFTFTVTATDTAGGVGSQKYTVQIDPGLSISPSSLPADLINKAYSQTLTPSGGSGAGYTWSESGTLPTGISFNTAGGIFTGTPTESGTFGNIQVTLTDNEGGSTTATYTLVIYPALTLSSSPTPLPYAAEGGSYSAAITATGGSGTPYTYALTSGSLPPGLNLNTSTGQITGKGTASTGTFTFTIQVTDSALDTSSQSFTIIAEGPVTISPATLAIGTAKDAYGPITFSASSTAGPIYTLTQFSGTLPTGMSFSSATDELSGTPTQSGTFNFTISATDGKGGTGSQSYTLVVDSALSINPTTLTPAAQGSPYTATLTASGGSGTGYSFSSTGLGGSWLSLSKSGVLTGTPPNETSVTFTVTVTDSNGGTTTQQYTLTVNPPLALGPASLPSTAQGDAYYAPLTASGGSLTGYTFQATATTGPSPTNYLPAGIGFSGNVLTGQDVTASPGTYTFIVTVTDSNGNSTSNNYSIVVGAPVSITPPALPAGTLGNVYTQTIKASGGILASGASYVYTETGPLPGGVTFNDSTGLLSGTPTTYGTFPIQVSATDSNGGRATQDYNLVINFALPNNANGWYVYWVYEKLLNRAPDPGAMYWYNLLNAEGPSAAPTVVAGVEGSTEYLGDVVTALYEHYLGRVPDSGAAGWVDQLLAGASIESVTASILASAEYYGDSGGTNTGFVKNLYSEVLGRGADSAGLAAWVNYLNAGGSRYQAALGFLTSTEYHDDLLDGGPWKAYSPLTNYGGYYPEFLHRSGDSGGMAFFSGQLASGISDQQVLASIFGSLEGFNDWNTKNPA